MSLFLGAGIALAGYFIGDGLKNWKNPSEKTFIDHFKRRGQSELIQEDTLHRFFGAPKQDTKELLQKYPDIPSVDVNGKTYFSRTSLRQWLEARKIRSD
ncbi:DNA-binding protein [Domibacillus sp. DTU_2020_1001157_1_SI_ALB_TIR_016]|uniref:DNA-binding protein n=1 Tax=Domibacillus sp. DTU_2020_1001157_1_SI_ALB_TIR_016 TaxID=3077789 RepID=UPI0028E29329|nr:DNA-binding protein [Domibacillus sp. DTU_2020_1001157_1_SI_ALB_TIR_016]WNS79962.1 DNA-binding protein [Domibacillus sp. DTU_2020_1001157_1_SI_ALB_TIR_016]